MPNRSKRKECLHATGTDLHVYNRGVDRTKIFYDEDDYLSFCELMATTLQGSGITILFYTLTPTDVDLVIRQKHPYDISLFMKRVCEQHATNVNTSRSRSGHLFKARYEITIVPDPGSLLKLSHDIHSKAVAAGLVKKMMEWPFSSARDYAGLTHSGLVTVKPLLDLIGGQESYVHFLKEYGQTMKPDAVWKYLLRVPAA